MDNADPEAVRIALWGLLFSLPLLASMPFVILGYDIERWSKRGHIYRIGFSLLLFVQCLVDFVVIFYVGLSPKDWYLLSGILGIQCTLLTLYTFVDLVTSIKEFISNRKLIVNKTPT